MGRNPSNVVPISAEPADQKLSLRERRIENAKQKNKDNVTFNFQQMRDDNVIGQKIIEARKGRKMNQKELAAVLELYGNSLSSAAISKWEKGESIPNALQLFALSDIFGIEDIRQYFLGDTPESPSFSAELNQKGLNILQAFKESLIASGQYSPQPRRRVTKFAEQVTRISKQVAKLPVSAGKGNFLDEDNFEDMEFPEGSVPEEAEFGLRISGDSMEPVYTHNQIVWVAKCDELNPGEVGIFVYDGCGYIKEYQEVMPEEDEAEEYTFDGVVFPKLYLVSYNKAYDPILVNSELGFQIVGRVLN